MKGWIEFLGCPNAPDFVEEVDEQECAQECEQDAQAQMMRQVEGSQRAQEVARGVGSRGFIQPQVGGLGAGGQCGGKLRQPQVQAQRQGGDAQQEASGQGVAKAAPQFCQQGVSGLGRGLHGGIRGGGVHRLLGALQKIPAEGLGGKSHPTDSNRRPTHYECVALPTELGWRLQGHYTDLRCA